MCRVALLDMNLLFSLICPAYQFHVVLYGEQHTRTKYGARVYVSRR